MHVQVCWKAQCPLCRAVHPLVEASSIAMFCHCFDIVKQAVHHVNPGQTPVICVDQPLFEKMKQLQWSMNTMNGEDKFVMLLGGLHTEMIAFKVLGHWLLGRSSNISRNCHPRSCRIFSLCFPCHKNQACSSSNCCSIVHFAKQSIHWLCCSFSRITQK